MRDQKVSEMTVLAMFVAIILVMGLIPYVGFIPLLGTTVTTLHVPVIIGAVYGGKRFGGAKFGLALGFAFGFISFLRAFTPFFQLDMVFQNPIVAIVPRVMFGGVAWYIYVAMMRFFKEKTWVWPIIFVLATLAHTILVLSTIVLNSGFYREFFGELTTFFIVVLPINGSFELVVAAILGSAIMVRIISYLDTAVES